MKNIQVFKPYFRTDEVLDEIKECLDKSWSGMGFKTVEIEKQWKEYTGHKHAHFLNSATVGLHLALNIFKKEYNWNDDDEVITTPLTFVSSNHAIVYENLKPVFVDVDDTLCLCPKEIEKAITSKTRAIMYVAIGGNVGHYEEVADIAKKHNLKLILDAAHSAGTKLNNKHLVEKNDVVVYSFQAVKNLPTADSGMICFREEQHDKLAREFSWLGINKDTFSRMSSSGSYKWRYSVPTVGFKYHGNSIMAAMAIVGLKYLDQDNEYRRQLASWYSDRLRNVKGIGFISQSENCVSSTHFFAVLINDRDIIMEKLNERGIYPGVHYAINTDYDPYLFAKGTCPKAEEYSEHLISLPVHLHLDKSDIDYICDALIELIS